MSSLTEQRKREVARRQFAPLPIEWEEIFGVHLERRRLLKLSGKSDGDKKIPNSDKEAVTITLNGLRSLIENEKAVFEYHSILEEIIDSYLCIICGYKNVLIKAAERHTNSGYRTPPDTGSKRKRSESPDAEPDPKRQRKTLESPPTDTLEEKGKEKIDSPARIKRSCDYLQCHEFGDLVEPPTHIGRNKTLSEVLVERHCRPTDVQKSDYLFLPHHRYEAHYILAGVAFQQNFVFMIDSTLHVDEMMAHATTKPILELLLSDFGDSTVDWPIYGQWANRKNTTDGSPNAPRQGDFHNCGVFAVTNAMCLAFGYDLMCYSQNDLNNGKRQRIGAELLTGSFKAPFNYELLDIPIVKVPTVIDRDGEKFRPTPPAADAEMRDAGVKTRRQAALKPILSHGEYPAQFNPRCFQKAGFLYAIKEPMFEKLNTKLALANECREHDIKGFTYWRKRPIHVFKRWMENVMAGRKAERSKGLKPFPHVDPKKSQLYMENVNPKEAAQEKTKPGKTGKTVLKGRGSRKKSKAGEKTPKVASLRRSPRKV